MEQLAHIQKISDSYKKRTLPTSSGALFFDPPPRMSTKLLFDDTDLDLMLKNIRRELVEKKIKLKGVSAEMID